MRKIHATKTDVFPLSFFVLLLDIEKSRADDFKNRKIQNIRGEEEREGLKQ